jgi:fused signal recognition particle receptor
MFSFLQKSLQHIYANVTSAFGALFTRATIDKEILVQIEKILITADVGSATTKKIINQLEAQFAAGTLTTGDQLQTALKNLLHSTMLPGRTTVGNVLILVGVNGSGKTTCAGKLAYRYKKEGKRVLLIAADTFRAAAVEQLRLWAERTAVEIFSGIQGQDPASVVYQGCQKFRQEAFDILIVDTAGRLQTSAPLMKELEKIVRTIGKSLPDARIEKLLVVDAMLGRNSFEQSRIFNETLNLDGIILSKMDGTAKGGVVFAIHQELALPVAYMAIGEAIEDLQDFDTDTYLDILFSK